MEATSYCTYFSTLSQVLGTFIALLGIFAIYALQRSTAPVRNEIITWLARNRRGNFVHNAMEESTLIRIGEVACNQLAKENKPEEARRGKALIEELKGIMVHKQSIRGDTKKLIFKLLALLGVTLTMLVICQLSYVSQSVINIIVYVVHALVIVMIVSAGRYVIRTIMH